MPLVNTRDMFKKAYEGGYAIGAFNVNNMEIIQGIVEGAQAQNAPLILQVSKGARAYANHTYLVKLVEAADTLMRFSINTVFGLGGIEDVASQANIDRHRQDFGQTLATYGVGTGPYLVLPLLGPSTVRDTVSLPLVWNLDVLSQVDNIASRNVLTALRVVDTRASLLRAGAVLDQAALDPYTFQRDVFLQLRDNQGARGGDEGLDDGGGVLPELPDAGKP